MVTDHLGDEEWDIGDILGVSNNLRLIASRHCPFVQEKPRVLLDGPH